MLSIITIWTILVIINTLTSESTQHNRHSFEAGSTNNTSSDIKHRLDLIIKKVNELKVLGVRVAVAIRWMNYNCVVGNPWIANVIDRYKDEI